MKSSLFIFIFLAHMSYFHFSQTGSVPIKHRYDSIFSFGDSLIDTGNLLLSNDSEGAIYGELPYGKTFGHPTGRASDGRLIVDFIAEEFGVPLLQPYLARSRGLDFRKGANFAVAGATALDITNNSLGVQLGWFKELKSSLCSTSKVCDEYFRKSLFLVGEIGLDDYLLAFGGGANMTQVRALVPLVIEVIAYTTSILIEEGALELVLPGSIPIGCSPLLLALFPSPNKRDYDPENGCLKPFNALAMYHNNLLKIALENLRRKYPQAKIIYADYYGATMRLIKSPKRYGFSNEAILSACCGGGGHYNFNASAICGFPGSKVCKVPSTYVYWDGDHLTEAAYRFIAKGILEGPYSSPPITLIN